MVVLQIVGQIVLLRCGRTKEGAQSHLTQRTRDAAESPPQSSTCRCRAVGAAFGKSGPGSRVSQPKTVKCNVPSSFSFIRIQSPASQESHWRIGPRTQRSQQRAGTTRRVQAAVQARPNGNTDEGHKISAPSCPSKAKTPRRGRRVPDRRRWRCGAAETGLLLRRDHWLSWQ